MTREELRSEIARRRPWYQRIAFPAHGISTTDDPADAMLDAAWDNAIGGLGPQEAALRRPLPKWDAIKGVLPPVKGLDVLEVGANCGFFSFRFAEQGARSVLGIDVAAHWLANAEWCRGVLGHDNVRFLNCDLMTFDPSRPAAGGLVSDEARELPLPNGCFDLVFMSTVLDHLFFPLLAIYKMIRMARRFVVIDVPQAGSVDRSLPLLHLGTSPGCDHHAFNTTIPFMRRYVARLGVPAEDISAFPYNEDNSVTYVIDTSRRRRSLHGA